MQKHSKNAIRDAKNCRKLLKLLVLIDVLQQGADILPAFAFGQTDMYSWRAPGEHNQARILFFCCCAIHVSHRRLQSELAQQGEPRSELLDVHPSMARAGPPVLPRRVVKMLARGIGFLPLLIYGAFSHRLLACVRKTPLEPLLK